MALHLRICCSFSMSGLDFGGVLHFPNIIPFGINDATGDGRRHVAMSTPSVMEVRSFDAESRYVDH